MRSLGADNAVIPGVTFVRCAISLPLKKTGSLKPAFAPARNVNLAVKPFYTFTLYQGCPSLVKGSYAPLRYPLGVKFPI